MRKFTSLVSCLLLIIVVQANGQALTGHYGPGLFGVRSAHGFPMGWSYVNVTHIYYAGEYKDNDGKVSTLSKPVNVIANISGGIWGKRWKKLNANYNAALILPFTNLAPNPETLEIDPERIGLGDIKVIPLMLSWNFDWLAVNARYAVWMPTGSFTAGSNNNRGKGFWSHNVGVGLTAYLDKERSWSLSSMNTFEFNSKQKTTNIRPASTWVTEWSIGKTFDKVFNLGIIGYNTNQLGNQEGGADLSNVNKYRVNGVGMELGYRTSTKWVFLTRWYLEYLAVNRPEGTAIRFILLKNF
ncbi:SphA family protein [Reichenbachiella sp.]|uniref:SphA family protein n=1 Tax=Reichenbachiella sp. TaxID=2184521 RepID=UPI003B5C2DC1